jgi:hypothetical protein
MDRRRRLDDARGLKLDVFAAEELELRVPLPQQELTTTGLSG